MAKNILHLKKDILEAGRRVYERGYGAANDGNISARLDKKHIVITPTGVSKGFMNATDLCVVDMTGRLVRGKKNPSSETAMHLRIYRERPDVNSVCHAHPPYATGFAVAGLPLDQPVLPEAVLTLGSVPLVPYGLTGTEDFVAPLLPFIRMYDAFLLANHGALTVGVDVVAAYHKMEILEHYAHILFIARTLGTVVTLTDEQVRQLIGRRERYGIRKNVGMPE